MRNYLSSAIARARAQPHRSSPHRPKPTAGCEPRALQGGREQADHCPICRESTPRPRATGRQGRLGRDRAPDALRQPAERHPPAGGRRRKEGRLVETHSFIRAHWKPGASEALARTAAGGWHQRLRDSPRDYRTPGRAVSSGVRDIV